MSKSNEESLNEKEFKDSEVESTLPAEEIVNVSGTVPLPIENVSSTSNPEEYEVKEYETVDELEEGMSQDDYIDSNPREFYNK